jgi:serine/threonine protein phosphatase PrpC
MPQDSVLDWLGRATAKIQQFMSPNTPSYNPDSGPSKRQPKAEKAADDQLGILEDTGQSPPISVSDTGRAEQRGDPGAAGAPSDPGAAQDQSAADGPSSLDTVPTARDVSPEQTKTKPRWELLGVDSAAPVIGKVMNDPDPRLGLAIPNRTASSVSDGVFAGQYYVAAASHVGLSHVAQGNPRQDAYNFAVTTSGRLVIAIADGMGSRPQSQVGATHFCDSVAFAASVRPDDSATEYLCAAAKRAGDVAEVTYRLDRDAVSFVAAVAVVDRQRCDVARIGDVSAFSINAEGEIVEMFPTDNEHVNVVDRSLPTRDVEPKPELVETYGTPRIVLATDGLANDLRTSTALRSWLGSVWAALPTAHAMSDALRYRRRGSHDDRTAVLIAIPEATSAKLAKEGSPDAREVVP